MILLLFFSSRSCVIIYYIFCNKPDQPELDENTPLIMQSEYFPRPGYDGYCLQGQEDLSQHALARGNVFPQSIDIDQTCDQHDEIEPSHSVFPKGILSVSQTKMVRMRKDDRDRYGDSMRSVSFNPQTYFEII